MKTLLALAILTLSTLTGFAAPYEVGSKVESFSAEDQHGTAFTLDPSKTRFLLVAHDMETSKSANAVLTTLGKTYLSDRSSYYLANIHGMPGVGRMFAIPKMKKYAHRIILGDDADLIARFPQQPGKATILKVTRGKIASVKYWDPATGKPDALLR